MSLQFSQAIVRGEISNEIPGLITGRIWLVGRELPVLFQLRGTPEDDVLARTLTFKNPHPEHEHEATVLAPLQQGSIAHFTSSRKVSLAADDGTTRIANCLHLAWDSNSNGAVFIETDEFEIQISEPLWNTADPPQILEIIDPSASEKTVESDPDGFLDDEDDDFDEEAPLNEFEWELELREADKQVDAYQAALEQFQEHADETKVLETVLGLDTLIDSEDDPPALKFDALPAEGDARDHHHFLTSRALDLAVLIQASGERSHVLSLTDGASDPSDNPVLQLAAATIQVGGKLGAALDGLAHGAEPEEGFVIAMLKRSLVPLNLALDASAHAIQHHHERPNVYAWLSGARDELFDLRKDIIDLMEELRAVL
ncbi:hypothetical protein OAF27_00110 [Verrucomicrobiales bacterium]|nr:hypothetical protein [Verrucomicrobiales bacterium]